MRQGVSCRQGMCSVQAHFKDRNSCLLHACMCTHGNNGLFLHGTPGVLFKAGERRSSPEYVLHNRVNKIPRLAHHGVQHSCGSLRRLHVRENCLRVLEPIPACDVAGFLQACAGRTSSTVQLLLSKPQREVGGQGGGYALPHSQQAPGTAGWGQA